MICTVQCFSAVLDVTSRCDKETNLPVFVCQKNTGPVNFHNGTKGTVSCERDDASVLYSAFVRSVSEPMEMILEEILLLL